MRASHSQFTANLGRARDLRALFVNLKATTAGAVDLGDILRAAIVFAVSAPDAFIHDITRIGMLEIYQNVRPRTDAFGRFSVAMESVLRGVATPGDTKWFEDEIRKQHGWLSFEQPDPRSAKNRLALIVDRRNKIAHEADLDPTSPGSRWPIDETLVQEAIDTLEQIGTAIFDVVTAP